MWVEAILTTEDLAKVMNELCPLRIRLGEGGSVLVSEPRALELVPLLGLRMTVGVELHWPVLGVQIPVAIRAAILEVKPEILKKPEGEHLTFKLRLDELDISMVPDFVDRTIVDRVNAELEAKHVELSWGFTETLSHAFDLPDALASARAIDLCAHGGWVKVTKDAMVLAVSFSAAVEPRDEPSRPPTPKATGAMRVASPRREPVVANGALSLWHSPAFAVAGGAAVLALIGLSGFALGRRRSRGLLGALREIHLS